MIITLDFETEGIEARPKYPPKPVGLALKVDTQESEYLSFGHSADNNCTEEAAKAALEKMWYDPKCILLMHNAKFDLDVAATHWGFDLNVLKGRVHDSMLGLYLINPHALTYSLKPASEAYLGLPPDEQDTVAKWLFDNQKTLGVKVGLGKDTKYPAGKYIALAPASLVSSYAIGDVDRTYRLWQEIIMPDFNNDARLYAAYNSEIELMFNLLSMEREGINVNTNLLEADYNKYKSLAMLVDLTIRNMLDAKKEQELSYDTYTMLNAKELVDALCKQSWFDKDALDKTKTGKLSFSKKSLPKAIANKDITKLLAYRNFVCTCVNTFYSTWLSMAKDGDKIYTQWHQSRNYHGNGTKTGRLSSTPNFQNIPNEGSAFDADFMLKYSLEELPLMKKYIIPAEGYGMIDRDYSQQELRIAGHYAGGRIKEFYDADINGDMHNLTVDVLAESGIDIVRKQAKTINFGVAYGMGARVLAEFIGVEPQVAKRILIIIKDKLGIASVENALHLRARTNKPYYTFGGRRYFCEKPRYDPELGKMMTYEYKMLNTLIQGSAADCTKLAVNKFYSERKNDTWNIVATIHDEIVATAPLNEVHECNDFLAACMSSIKVNIMLTSDGGVIDNLGIGH